MYVFAYVCVSGEHVCMCTCVCERMCECVCVCACVRSFTCLQSYILQFNLSFVSVPSGMLLH